MRFIRPDGETSTSTPARKPVTDENSFEPRGTTGRVSPALVSRAQSLISPEISSDKLLLPQRGTGTRRIGIELDEVSHAAAMGEESTRPAIARELSKRSVGETSFEVSMDEDEPDEEEGDVSAEELMRPSQRGQWSVPASYVSEIRLPTSSRSKELEPSEDRDVVEDGIQVGNTAIRSEGESEEEEEEEEKEEEEEEEEEEGNEDHEESGVLVEFSSRRYHQPEHHHEYAAEDELSGSDRVDYHQPESYIDDEELSGEDSEEEDELRHAKYYSQTRAGRQEEEEYYNSEEEDEAEVHPQHYDQDEYILHSDDEKQEDRDRESHSWQGIGNTTPFTDLSHLPSHHQSPQVTQLLDPLLDQPTQSYPLTQRAVQNHRNDGDLHNPAMFYQTTYPPMLPAHQEVDPGTASSLDEVLAFDADLPNPLPELDEAEEEEDDDDDDEQNEKEIRSKEPQIVDLTLESSDEEEEEEYEKEIGSKERQVVDLTLDDSEEDDPPTPSVTRRGTRYSIGRLK